MASRSASSRTSQDTTAVASLPLLTNSNKASTVPPKVSTNGMMELDERRSPPEEKLPLHEDIMQLARLGEIEPVKKLFEDGKFDAQYQDAEGITPLHVRPKTISCPAYKLCTDIRLFSGQRSITILVSASS